jgi:hypothetical protein
MCCNFSWTRTDSLEGDPFIVYFNGEQAFETEDQTFTKAGKTGLWTKGDSVTYFDDFTVSGN